MSNILITLELEYTDSHVEAVRLDNLGRNVWSQIVDRRRPLGSSLLRQGVFKGQDVVRYVVLPGLIAEDDILVEDWDPEEE